MAPFCAFMPKYLASASRPKYYSSLCVHISCILLLIHWGSETLPSIFGNSCANHHDSCEEGFSPCFSVSIRFISSLCLVALAGISNMIVDRNGSVGTVDVTEHSTQEESC